MISTNGTKDTSFCVNRRQRGRSRLEPCIRFRAELRDLLRFAQQDLAEVFSVRFHALNSAGLGCLDLMRYTKEWMESGLSKLLTGERRRLGRKERIGIVASMGSLKKALPKPCDCVARSNMQAFKDQLSKKLVPSQEYLEYCRKMIRKEFPVGWDKDLYARAIKTANVGAAACVEASRKKGGCSYAGKPSHTEFVKGMAEGDFEVERPTFKYTEVLTSGKIRPLTVTPWKMQFVRGLHKAMYNHISAKPWLLRGQARCDLPGGFILSGDYKGATDNLSVEVAECLLEEILARSTTVPDSVKSQALLSLRPTILFPDGTTVDLERGQMMGSLLSFPLLCLQNNAATTYALGNVPRKINGDDLIAKVDDPEKWFRLLPSLGLEPERSKTQHALNSCNINSTSFLYKNGSWQEVPQLRLKMLYQAPKELVQVGRTCNSFLNGFKGHARTRAAVVFMRRYASYIAATRLTLPALGFSGYSSLRAAQLLGWFRRDTRCARMMSVREEFPTPPSEMALPAVNIRASLAQKWVTKLSAELTAYDRWQVLFKENNDAQGAWNERMSLPKLGKRCSVGFAEKIKRMFVRVQHLSKPYVTYYGRICVSKHELLRLEADCYFPIRSSSVVRVHPIAARLLRMETDTLRWNAITFVTGA